MDNYIMENTHATYLRKPLQAKELRILANEAASVISSNFPDIDYVVGSGISGVAVLSAISYVSEVNIFIIRKDEDINNHSFIGINTNDHRKVEFFPSSNKNATAIIVDDLISTGDTMMRIYHQLLNRDILAVGIFLYAPSKYGNNPDHFTIDDLDIPIFYSKKDCRGDYL